MARPKGSKDKKPRVSENRSTVHHNKGKSPSAATRAKQRAAGLARVARLRAAGWFPPAKPVVRPKKTQVKTAKPAPAASGVEIAERHRVPGEPANGGRVRVEVDPSSVALFGEQMGYAFGKSFGRGLLEGMKRLLTMSRASPASPGRSEQRAL